MGISNTADDMDGADRPLKNLTATIHEPDLVRAQLLRILGSCEFQGSERTRRFLRFVVEEALAGRADRIKAFSVAVAAFDRDDTFNPQSDPIVRIEAGRLRRCLERYYLVAGERDDIRIGIPKGSYVPEFSWNQNGRAEGAADGEAPSPVEAPATSPLRRLAPPSQLMLLWASLASLAVVLAAAIGTMVVYERVETMPPIVERAAPPSQPVIAVLPFGGGETEPRDDAFSAGMTNEIVRELSQHSTILVMGPRSLKRFGSSPDVMTVGREAGTAFVLSGDVHHLGDQVRVAVELSETSSGSVIWAEAFDRMFDVKEMFNLQGEIAREIVRNVAQPQGAIALFDWKRTRGIAPESWAAYDCVVQAEDLQRRGKLEQKTTEVRDCLNRAVKQEPGYADAWIMLALLEIDAVRYTPQKQISPERLEAAYAAAQHGIELAPDSGRAHMALMMAMYFRGEVERALAVGDVALRLSPQDPDVISEVGLRQVVAGSPDAGLDLLGRAARLYDDPPAGLRLALSLGYLRKGQFAQAATAIDRIVPNANFVYLAVAAAVYGKAEKSDAARLAADELQRVYPDFGAWAAKEVAQRFVAPELGAALMQGWEAAGLIVDLPAEPALNP